MFRNGPRVSVGSSRSRFIKRNEERFGDCSRKKTESSHYDLFLHGSVSSLSEWISQWTVDEKSARRVDALRHFLQQRYGNCRNPGFLDDALNQSHGLVAHRSNRRQQNRIHVILGELAGNFRGRDL